MPVSCGFLFESFPIVHLATFVASSYRQVPTLTVRFVVRTALGNGIVSATSSIALVPWRGDSDGRRYVGTSQVCARKLCLSYYDNL